MCRALLYLGNPLLLESLLYKPAGALITQSYRPRMLGMLNLAGFGVMAWDSRSHNPEIPYTYTTPSLPVFDRNLLALSQKVEADTVVAHIRGVAYSPTVDISLQNTHPFCFPGAGLTMAHNGNIYDLVRLRADILQSVDPDIVPFISGSTDSELIYALVLSQLADPWARPTAYEVVEAVKATILILKEIRRRHGVAVASSMNLFFSNGRDILAVRYCFDFGCFPEETEVSVHDLGYNFLSLWYTAGAAFEPQAQDWNMTAGGGQDRSVLIASEPLSHDISTWLEVPEYTMLVVERDASQPEISLEALPV